MALSSVGLRTHIWNNNLTSLLLLVLFPVLLLGIIGLGVYAHSWQTLPGGAHLGHEAAMAETWQTIGEIWPVVLIVTAAWFTISFLFHQFIIEKTTHAHPVKRHEHPEIYNMLENLALSRGMRMPRLCIIESTALNAFASGLSEKTYTVTLTRGLIEALDKEELEAVIAHELTHIINRDVRLLVISVVFVGIITVVAEMIYRSLLYSRAGDRRNKGKAVLIAFIVLAVGYGFAMLIRFSLSRRREYMADAGAVELTKNPQAMIRALEKISGNAEIQRMPDEVREMCIENRASGFLGLFATHPPIERRIEVLRGFC